MILSAIGAVMVVDVHSWTALGPLTNYLPYNSFFMQMFVFISGYFFVYSDDMKLGTYIKKKSLKMLLPYYIWWCIYGFIVWFFKEFTTVNIGDDFSLRHLILGPWLSGEDWEFNSPSWFVSPLFLIQVIYMLMRKLCKNYWNDWIAAIAFVILEIAAMYIEVYHGPVPECANIFRVMAMLIYYQLGVLYRKYFEQGFRKTGGLAVCSFCVLAGCILVNIFGNTEFYFNKMEWRIPETANHTIVSLVLPIVTAVIGIAFWLKVCQYLEPILGENRLVNFISNHTFEIMMNHAFCMWAANWLLVLNQDRIFAMDPEFAMYAIYTFAWFRWEGLPQTYLFYFIFGLFGSLLIAYISDIVKKRIHMLKRA